MYRKISVWGLKLRYLSYYVNVKFSFSSISSSPSKILVIAQLGIGDSVNLTPFLTQLRGEYAQSKIYLLVKPPVDELFYGNNVVDTIVLWGDSKKNVNKIKTNNFDCAYIVDSRFDSSLLAYKAGIKIRIGRNIRGNGFLLSHSIDAPEYIGKPLIRYHTPEKLVKKEYKHFLDIFSAIKKTPDYSLPLKLTPQKSIIVNNFINKNQIDNFIIIHSCGSAPSKNMSESMLSNILDALPNTNILLTGSVNDISFLAKHKRTKVFNTAGIFSLKDLIYLISCTMLVVSVDTGIAHITAALNRPLITIFGPANPKIWAPYSEKSVIVYKKGLACIGCKTGTCYRKEHYCLNAKMSPVIVSAIKKILDYKLN